MQKCHERETRAKVYELHADALVIMPRRYRVNKTEVMSYCENKRGEFLRRVNKLGIILCRVGVIL